MTMQNLSDEAVFVRLNEYKDALALFESLKSKISDAKSVLEKIEYLQNEEKTEVELWKNSIHEVERKIDYIDSLMVGKN